MEQSERQPVVLVIAGPNGAGKSTAAPLLVHEMAGIDRYINADAIARGFSPFKPDLSAVTAGRLMIEHMSSLVRARQDFALETTLSGVRLSDKLEGMRSAGYRVQLIFLWLPSADLAVRRVDQRVSLGGHSIPDQTVRRRYTRGLENLLRVYMPIVDLWRVFDNSRAVPCQIANGGLGRQTQVLNQVAWDAMCSEIG